MVIRNTISTPSTRGATATGSVTASTGGVSTTTKSYCPFSSASTSWNFGLVKSSAGLSGRGPHGITKRFSISQLRTADESFASPATTEASPTSGCCRLNSLWTRGLRKSQSSRTTRLPLWAIEMARFAARVLLPSPGVGLVTWMTWWPRPWVLK